MIYALFYLLGIFIFAFILTLVIDKTVEEDFEVLPIYVIGAMLWPITLVFLLGMLFYMLGLKCKPAIKAYFKTMFSEK